jgi:flagellin
MRINHNISALNTYRQLTMNTTAGSKSLEKLSSGYRINRAGDDAAGLAISEKMRGQIRGLTQASRNAQDGISLIQTAEGALNETQSILQRMRELAVQAGNDTNTAADRAEIQKEINQLTSEINRIGNTTEFNTQKLLNGGAFGSAEVSGATLSGGMDAQGAVAAVYTFSFTGDFAVGDVVKFTYNDVNYTFTAVTAGDDPGKFLLGADLDATLTNLAAKISGALDGWSAAAVAEADGGAITITAETDGETAGAAGNGLFTGVGIENAAESTAELVAATQTKDGADAVDATNATGKISFSNNLLASGTRITINDVTFVLYDSSKGEIPSAGSGIAAIDLAGMESNEELIDAIVEASDSISDVTVKKTGLYELTITADTEGAAANAYVLSVTGPQGQTGTFAADFQIGANKGQSMSIAIGDMRSVALGVSSLAGTSNTVIIDGAEYEVAWAEKAVTDGTSNVITEAALSVATASDASKAIEVLDAAITKVSGERSKLGAYQNRLEHTINNLDTSAENLTASESRIRDVDMAKEMMEFTKNNILQQAAQAMLAQANMQPQGILQLLR